MSNPSPGFRERPDHRITVEPFEGTVTVRIGDKVLATSSCALELREASYPPVFYIPFADIDFDMLAPTQTSTHCPFKGDASYWRVRHGAEATQDVMWAYRAPYDEMRSIADHGAFYANRTTIETRRAG